LNKHLITISGKKKLEQEYNNLLKNERPKIITAIEEARAHGDLKENAEYHAAKERQSFIETRIEEISTKLANSEIIDPSKINSDTIKFGATVSLINLDTETLLTYQIVGLDEADVKNKSISYMSPLARALIGKKAGDEISVNTPRGEVNYEVSSVTYK